MAERQFVMIIRNETGGDGAGKKVGGAGGIQNQQGGNTSSDSGDKKKKGVGDLLAKKANGLITYATISSVVDTVVSYNNSLIEVRTGSKELQERTTYKYNTAKSFVNSAVGGAIAGSAYGPWGAAAGLVLGVATAGFNYVKSRSMAENTIRENERLEIAQRQMAAQRITVSGSRYMNATQM
jgi:hypothetical protein